jgi:hypothetical protein
LATAGDAIVQQEHKPFYVLTKGDQMKFELSEPLRRGFGIALRAFLFSAAIGSAQAQSQDCNDLYGAIRGAAMYCGFFCDQNELRPLQAAYEAQCIVSVIPASALGFDSSPGPSASFTTYTESRPQPVALLQSVRRNSQQLLEISQGISPQQFASKSQRMLSAEALLGYCKAALARVPYKGPRVGLTEESGDRSDATLEFAQWRLSTIFGDCAEAAHGILDAKEVRHEAAAWIKIAQFLEQDEAVRELCINAEVPQSRCNGAGKDDIFATGNWRTMRTVILEAAWTLCRDP